MATLYTDNIADIEKEIEDSFVTGLRAVFRHDPVYTYNEDIAISRVMISSAYPEKDAEFKIPQIVVAGTGFNTTKTSLFDNYYGDIIEDGIVVGKKYITQVPYSTSLICFANRDGTAKDLANKVFNYISFVASEIFDDVLYLNITGVSKSPGSPIRQIPNNAFAHTTGLTGTLSWEGKKITSQEYRHILKEIKLEITKE